ncbi:hypothetical protein AAF712_013252 [Marasmius tenuissimus]|uniref:Uncharacterized protein n=1 Tax=Marasmius tenuissimus TaxID=585030 RepID=A0ABR2ZG75_9AGAR
MSLACPKRLATVLSVVKPGTQELVLSSDPDIEAGAEHSLATGDPHGDDGFGQVDTTSPLANESPSMARDEGDAIFQDDAVQNARPANSRRLRNAPTPETRGPSTSNMQIDDAQTTQAPPTADPTPQSRETPRGDDEPVAEEGDIPAPYNTTSQTHVNSIPTRQEQLNKNTKAHLTIGALNMRGLGSTNFNDPRNKWYHINQLMRDKKIGVLVLGEAHLNTERKQQIEELFKGKIKVVFSSIPNNPNAKGIAVALHRDITNMNGIQTWEIVAGHALLVEYNWRGTKTLSILAVYAPNEGAANRKLWEDIEAFFERHPGI